MKIVSGILLGSVAAFFTITVAEYLLNRALLLLPLGPDGPRPGGPIVNVAWPLQLLIVVGWLAGALVGAFVAGQVAQRSATGWVSAGLVAIAGIVNLTMIPHPVWMSLAAVLAPIAGGWIGVRLATRRT